jgi:hypothetical protein
MSAQRKSQPELYGVAPIGISRYFALYLSQIGWLVLGAFLLANAYWPSTCRPGTIVEIYACSARLDEGQSTWIEAALMTWLWTTPFLVVLEVMRRFKKQERR